MSASENYADLDCMCATTTTTTHSDDLDVSCRNMSVMHCTFWNVSAVHRFGKSCMCGRRHHRVKFGLVIFNFGSKCYKAELLATAQVTEFIEGDYSKFP